ncbi:unnamed protein product [marine sediment metagenome]|uniref:Bacterial Ig-like domain-containing protein n=1 Tax=marine sediment metagenome TaxID=412755 RepID=X0UUU7_9ZZZZ
MKNILILLMLCCLIIASASVSFADYLACDIQPNIVASEVEIDGTVQPGIATVSGSNLLLFDVDGLGPGPHQFKARLQDASGWWGDWNASFLDASKPGQAGLRIVE